MTRSVPHSASFASPADGSPPSGEESASGADAPIDWSAMLAKHDRWLRTVVGARVGEPQAVDEVMQEVSLAAVRGHAPIADRSQIAPWLYQLAVRQSLLYRRKMGRRRKLVGQYADRFHPTEQDHRTADPLDWLLAEERQRLVRLALARMVPRDSEILLLKYIEGWSYHELAEHLGVSHSAAESRLHRARASLREQLAIVECDRGDEVNDENGSRTNRNRPGTDWTLCYWIGWSMANWRKRSGGSCWFRWTISRAAGGNVRWRFWRRRAGANFSWGRDREVGQSSEAGRSSCGGCRSRAEHGDDRRSGISVCAARSGSLRGNSAGRPARCSQAAPRAAALAVDR